MQKLVLASTLCVVIFLFAGCNNWGTNPDNGENGNNNGDNGNVVSNEILFIRHRGPTGAISEICTISPDGTNLRIFASHDASIEYVSQGYRETRWSPDKSLLAVVGGPADSREYHPIWLMDLEGELIQRLTWAGSGPIWLDQDSLLFQRRRSYFSLINDIYTVNTQTVESRLVYEADDSTRINISGKINSEWLLGNRVVFYTDSAGKQDNSPPNIVKVNIQTGEIRNITENSAWEGFSRISPNRKQIVFTRKYINEGSTWSYGPANIILKDLSTGEEQQLTQNTQQFKPYFHLAWGPKGEYVVYSSYDDSSYYGGYHVSYPDFLDIYTLHISTGAIDTVTHTAKDSIVNFVMEWR